MGVYATAPQSSTRRSRPMSRPAAVTNDEILDNLINALLAAVDSVIEKSTGRKSDAPNRHPETVTPKRRRWPRVPLVIGLVLILLIGAAYVATAVMRVPAPHNIMTLLNTPRPSRANCCPHARSLPRRTRRRSCRTRTSRCRRPCRGRTRNFR